MIEYLPMENHNDVPYNIIKKIKKWTPAHALS